VMMKRIKETNNEVFILNMGIQFCVFAPLRELNYFPSNKKHCARCALGVFHNTGIF
jgi:hypothetical protein